MCALERVKFKYWKGWWYQQSREQRFIVTSVTCRLLLMQPAKQVPQYCFTWGWTQSSSRNGVFLRHKREWTKSRNSLINIVLFLWILFIYFFRINSTLAQCHADENFDGILTEKIKADSSQMEQPIKTAYACHARISKLSYEMVTGQTVILLRWGRKKEEITLLFCENKNVILDKTCSGKQTAIRIRRNICRDICLSAVGDTEAGYDLRKFQVESRVFT